MTRTLILYDVKKMLGIIVEDDAFDTEIKIYINSALARLSQLGVVFNSDTNVDNSNKTWSSLFGENSKLNQIQTYIYLKVKLLFDPPSSATVLQSYESQIKELEWEINVVAEREENSK